MNLLTGWLPLCLLLAPAAPQGLCPDEQATFVKGRTLNQGGSLCSKGLTLFGTKVGSFGTFCPAVVVSHPEHRVCLGEPAKGYRCAQTGLVAITAQRCRCIGIGSREWSLDFDGCQCSAPVAVGMVADAVTRACEEHP